MASLVVNRAAQVALRTLNSVQQSGAEARLRISTGLKVRSATDNAAFFLVANQTRSDVVVNKGIREALIGVDASIEVSFTGLRSIRENLQNIRSAIIAGEQAGYDNGLQDVIRGQIDSAGATIRATSANDTNFLSDGPGINIITALTRNVDGSLDTQVTSIQSLALDRETIELGEGLEEIAADTVFDLSGGGSVVRFGGRYKVTSLTTDNIVRSNSAFNTYRNGPAAADPAPRIVHPSGSNKQWILSDYSDDFRTRNGTGNSVFGGGGNDRLVSGTNNSVLVGGAGDDIVQATRNGDRAFGGDGDDFVRGTRDGNLLVGGRGNDRISGGGGAQTIYGGEGNDFISGGNGADVIIGGTGSDDIRAGGGADLIYEGFDSGSDTIRLQGGGGTVFYEGDASRYVINVIGGTRFTVTDTVTGAVDDIRNGTPADLVFGVAPPDDPDVPVASDFLENSRVDFSTLTDPVGGQAAREGASFMLLLTMLDPEQPGYSVDGALLILDSAEQKLNFGESQLGSIQSTIQRSMRRAQLLSDSLEQGVAALVEADLAEESAVLAAVQAQEQLAIDGIGLANSRASLVLSLFS